jgi:hypothetical protein
VIRKETNGAASESLTASLIDNNFYHNLIKKNSDDKECQTARAPDLKKNPQTTTDPYLSLPLIKYNHKLCSEIYYVIWDVIFKTISLITPFVSSNSFYMTLKQLILSL